MVSNYKKKVGVNFWGYAQNCFRINAQNWAKKKHFYRI